MSKFDELRFAIADQMRRLVDSGRDARGPMRGPELDLTSPAHHDLKDDVDLTVGAFANPVALTLGHVERLLVAADDHAHGLNRLLTQEQPPWFSHIAVVRAGIETMGRVWLLTDSTISSTERVTRYANELLYEIQHGYEMLNGPFKTLPPDLINDVKTHLQARRGMLIDWANAHEVPNPGGMLGAGRLRPTETLIAMYQWDSPAVPHLDALGAWHYSEASAVAHGLPDGMRRYFVGADAEDPDAHAHLVLSIEDLVGSLEPWLSSYEAMVVRLAQFFRWEIPDALTAELVATRMQLNRTLGYS
jgi:hypothetical protein